MITAKLEHDREINQAYFDDGYSQGTDAAIERCAQVAEKDGWHKAADAIRKLKGEDK